MCKYKINLIKNARIIVKYWSPEISGEIPALDIIYMLTDKNIINKVVYELLLMNACISG